MKKLLTIFITLILTLFIAQQSFAVQADEDERDASAEAGEMVGQWVDFDGLDQVAQDRLMLLNREGQSREEHLEFLKRLKYQVSRGEGNELSIIARSYTPANVPNQLSYPTLNANGVAQVTVFSREIVVDKGTSPAVNQPNALVTGEQAEGYRMRDVSSREVAIRPVPGTSPVDQSNALVTGEQAEGYRMHGASSREVAIRPSDKATTPGASPNNVQYVDIGNDLDTNGTIASVNASDAKTKSTYSEVTISHFIPHAGVKIGVNNRKASESHTSGEGVLIASIVNSANNLLME